MADGIIYITEDREIRSFYSINEESTKIAFTSLPGESVIYYDGTENLTILSEEEQELYKAVRKSLFKQWGTNRIETNNIPKEQLEDLNAEIKN